MINQEYIRPMASHLHYDGSPVIVSHVPSATNDCDIIDNNYWISDGQGLTRRFIMDTDPRRNRGPQDADVCTTGVLLSVDDIDTLRSRNGAAGEDEKTMPWRIA